MRRYVGTGRALATRRVKFGETNGFFELYSFSHMSTAVDVCFMLLLTLRYNALGVEWYLSSITSLWLGACAYPLPSMCMCMRVCMSRPMWYLTSISSLWVVAFSWLMAPALYNPFAFSLADLRKDYNEWAAFLRSARYENHFYGHKEGDRERPSLTNNNWFSWLNAEPWSYRLITSLVKLAIWGAIAASIARTITYLPNINWHRSSSSMTMQLAAVVLALLLLGVLVRLLRVPWRMLEFGLTMLLLVILGTSIGVQAANVWDALIQAFLCLFALLKALGALLELLLLGWSEGFAPRARSATLVSGGRFGRRANGSRDRLLFPRECALLKWGLVLQCGRASAELQALIYFALSTIVGVVLAMPLVLFILLLLVGLTLRLLLPSDEDPLDETLAETVKKGEWSKLLYEPGTLRPPRPPRLMQRPLPLPMLIPMHMHRYPHPRRPPRLRRGVGPTRRRAYDRPFPAALPAPPARGATPRGDAFGPMPCEPQSHARLPPCAALPF